jgi:cytochrome b subunit of formate dehydrogenase
MLTGNVNELFAYSHHFKWWRKVKLAEQARERKQATGTREKP